MAAKKRKQKQEIEWVGGIVTLPAYVTGEGEPYRPEVLIWMIPDGPVLGFSTAEPGRLLNDAHENLLATIRKPMVGLPHTPTRLRVGSPVLASALREALPPTIEVVCSPAPEIDHVVASMAEKMAEGTESEERYLSPGIGADAVAALFRAAAGLFRAKVWSVLPSEHSELFVTIEDLAVHDAVVMIIGRVGDERGFLVFSGVDAFEAFLEGIDAVKRGENPDMPSHFALHFDRDSDLSPRRRKEIAEHRWEVVSSEAYPWVVGIDGRFVARPPTTMELTMAEAIALALQGFLADTGPLIEAGSEGEPFTRTLRVKAHTGEIDVILRLPGEEEIAIPDDLLTALADLEVPGEDLDEGARFELEDALLERFIASPEANALNELHFCDFIMDFAASHFGVTIASLEPAQLREIVFEIIPRKMSVEAKMATSLIAEGRAFFAFLKREFGLEQADACLRVLDGDADKKLEAALSDPRNFGMAKSLVMAGREAGFDVSTKEGIEAWMQEVQSRPLSPPFVLPAAPPRPVPPAEARAKKNQRKAARKARRKNR